MHHKFTINNQNHEAPTTHAQYRYNTHLPHSTASASEGLLLTRQYPLQALGSHQQVRGTYYLACYSLLTDLGWSSSSGFAGVVTRSPLRTGGTTLGRSLLYRLVPSGQGWMKNSTGSVCGEAAGVEE